MIEATAGEAKAGRNIVQVKVRQLFEHLLSRQICYALQCVID